MKKIGQFEEYYVSGKYIGNKLCDPQPERIPGYAGKQTAKADSNIRLGRRTIKAGQEYTTVYYEMQGKSNPI